MDECRGRTFAHPLQSVSHALAVCVSASREGLRFLHLPFPCMCPVDQQKHLLELGIGNRMWSRLCLCKSIAHRSKTQASSLPLITYHSTSLPWWNSFRCGLHNLTGRFQYSQGLPFEKWFYRIAFMEEALKSYMVNSNNKQNTAHDLQG